MSSAGNLPVEGQSLALTPNLRAGLKAITVLAFVSFFAATLLFVYLGYKLIWYMYIKPARKAQDSQQSSQEEQPKSFQQAVDFALGIDGIFDEQAHHDSNGKTPVVTTHDGRRGSKLSTSPGAVEKQRNPPNQFLLLIFNLLLADMHQGIAFFLNVEWLRRDEVSVGTATCFTQGLFVSTGDLASSCFITTIAVHTYLSVVKRYRPSHRALCCVIVGVWLFVYLISTLPIAATRNGAEFGGFFVRAGTWVSSINSDYAILCGERLTFLDV